MEWPKTVLMATPEFFDVEYAINPHMNDADGQLHRIDQPLAQTQWLHLKQKFESLGVNVAIIDGQKGWPDMVFTANPCFPYLKDNRMHLLLSQMHAPQRKSEPKFIAQWAEANNIPFTVADEDMDFEGMGDALWNYETEEIYGGYGFRTKKEAYQKLTELTGKTVHLLELKSPYFYHLDTCLCILNGTTAMAAKEAFSNESWAFLKSKFSDLIEIDPAEAKTHFAGNACSVNGKDVLLPTNCPKTMQALIGRGFSIHLCDTSEYIKSGGSVFCMKMQLWSL